MNVPFSISDILERVIPGAVLLGGALSALKGWGAIVSDGEATSQFATFTVFALLSYVFGLITNIISGLVPKLDLRSDDHSEILDQRVLEAYLDFFGKEYDATAWKWCYGIVVKHGYAINTDFFQGVYVFCSSIFVALAALVPLYLWAWIYRDISVLAIIGILFAAWAFFRGSQKYSKLFALSILEAFYSYWVEHSKK